MEFVKQKRVLLFSVMNEKYSSIFRQMDRDCWRISLTDAALRPPLTEKEV